jgi:hypothetical protein
VSRHDELPPAVVAAITAILTAMQELDEEPDEERVWARSGQVAPSWSERGKHAWRDGQREQGWKP